MTLDFMYATLGLRPGAGLDQVTTRYRRLIAVYHPDRNASPDAAERFRQIRSAYLTLEKHLKDQKEEAPSATMRPCRRAYRLTPSHRRFGWKTEDEYKGTRVRYKV